MLINPAIDMLRELGLYGWQPLSRNSTHSTKCAASSMANGLPCCSNARRPCAARSVSRLAPGLPNFAMTRRSRMPTSAPHAASTAICSWRLPAATGSESITVFLSPGPAGVGKSWLACALGHQACREGLLSRLPSDSPAVRRPRACKRRRAIRQDPQISCQDRPADPRWLGT